MKMPWELPEMISLDEKRITPMTSRRRNARFVFNNKGICFYCEKPTESSTPVNPRHPTRDHKMPKVRGGTNAQDNIALCCVGCNNVKADMTEVEFRYFMKTGKLAETYVAWIATRFLVAAVRLKVPVRLEGKP